jgi:hypothetical protein
MATEKTISYDENMVAIRTQKYCEGAKMYQERRHPDWRENYSLYRDKVQTNRLTQRQSVNVPLMKETIRTLLSKTDEFPDLYYESLSNDKQKEIFLNEYWKYWVNVDNFEIKDIVDKKQEGLYGRSTMKLNLLDGRPSSEVLEPYDWVVDRYADPADLDGTSMYQGHLNIFRSISQIEANPLYDKSAVSRLKVQYAQAMGLARSEENIKQLIARNERMQDMGLWDIENPSLGEAFLNLTEHYIKLWSPERKKLVIWIRVMADNEVLLMKPLEDLLAINFYPFISWADDIEKTDVYSDGVGDIVRTPNKILNSWFSQLVENRTLRNYGMTFYDATASEKWIPQTYEPVPWGWYPTAGDPNKTTKRVDIPELSESLPEMQFVIGMVEKATASTATEKGVQEEGEATLGQIKLMLQSSNERITSIAKFYRVARRQFGEKWYKFLMANEKWIEPVKLQKKSHKGNYFEEIVSPADWKDEAGYVCKVVSTSERNQKNVEEVQKIQAVSGMFPENVPLKRIMKKKALDLIDGLSQEEIDEVLDYDESTGADLAPVEGEVPRNPQGAPVVTA